MNILFAVADHVCFDVLDSKYSSSITAGIATILAGAEVVTAVREYTNNNNRRNRPPLSPITPDRNVKRRRVEYRDQDYDESERYSNRPEVDFNRVYVPGFTLKINPNVL